MLTHIKDNYISCSAQKVSMEAKTNLLKEFATDKYIILEGYIDNLRSRYRINLNIHDIAGISTISPAMEKILGPYLYHNNSFCNYIKKNSKNFNRCLKQKEKLCLYCKETDTPFYGKCYMGVEEFLFPVKWQNKLIAIICVGHFFEDADFTTEYIGKKASEYQLNENQCIENYFDIAIKSDFNIKELSVDLGILCQHLLYLYVYHITNTKLSVNLPNKFDNAADDHKSTHIVANTISFIQQNYHRDISLTMLAENSFCNPSYLSHSFKEKAGINISDYICQIRIEAAKQVLDTTNKNITDICFMVGFNDSNYFSKVFKSLTNMTPTEYRNRKF